MSDRIEWTHRMSMTKFGFTTGRILILSVLCAMTGQIGHAAELTLEAIPGQADENTAEIHGLGAGTFDPTLWQANTLHFVPDARRPLIAPRLSGVFRNIYAPCAIETPEGWRVFYGAWDGVDTGNDRIYSVTTRNFLDFDDHILVIDHGPFQHACNVNVIRAADGSFEMVCTVFPDDMDRNKPAIFRSPDGKQWNGSPQPYAAAKPDIVTVNGYENYPNADINGMNVLYRDGGTLYLYFCNFKDRGRVYRAVYADGNTFTYEGPALESPHVINDLKTLHAGGKPWHLMALHKNIDGLWYSLSENSAKFEHEKRLIASLDDGEKYIVAVGWVIEKDRVLGFLYGAGASPKLNRNRIFARWLQKRLVVVSDDGRMLEPDRALGPDRQLLALPEGKSVTGKMQLFGDDGTTLIAEGGPFTLNPMLVYRAGIK
jgi:hypothetical protein